MVNKYTTGIPIIKPIDRIDVDFAHQVLVKKQEQFDNGYANLEKLFQSVEGLGLTKDNEKSYLQGKLKETTERINKLGNIDYSDSKLVGALGIEVGNIAKDPVIQNAVLNKQAYSQLMDRYTKLKENPKLYEQYYSPYNEAEDMEQVKNYLSTNDLKHQFRLNTPTFKVDIDKKIDEELTKKMKIKSQRSDGMYVYTSEGLTEPQLRVKVQADIMSNPNYAKQLAINAKWKYNNDEDFNKNLLNPLVNSYNTQIDVIEKEIQNKATALNNSKGVGKEQQYNLIKAEKENLENQLKQFKSTRDALTKSDTPLIEKKKMYEMMQLQDRAVLSFPQSVTRKADEFSILGVRHANRLAEMKEGFGYDVLKMQQQSKIDIEEARIKDSLGLGGSKSSSGGTTSENGINPIGEAMPTTTFSTDNKEGVLLGQIESFKTQNGEDFIGLMSQVISQKMSVENPKAVQDAVRAAFVKNQQQGLGGNFYNEYIKKTPSYQKLTKIAQDGLIAQYNHINSAYRDVLDGKQDVDYSSWEFDSQTQEALTKIQLRSYNMRMKEDMLNKAKKEAEDKMIKDVYRGDRKKFEEDKNRKEIITNVPNTGMMAGLPSTRVSSKAEFNTKLNDYMESSLLQQNISLEKPYLISEDGMKKENYASVKSIVRDAISNGGIYETLNRTDDPIGLYGKIEGKDSKNDKFKNAKDFNVVKIWGDSGIAEVEVVMKEGDKEIKNRGYVKIKQEGINEMYNFGLNRKSGDVHFNEVVENYGASPIMMSGTNPPLFYKVVKNTYDGKYNVKLSLTSSANDTIHLNFPASTPSGAKQMIDRVVREVMNNPEIQAIPPSEQKRKIIFDLINKKYNELVAK